MKEGSSGTHDLPTRIPSKEEATGMGRLKAILAFSFVVHDGWAKRMRARLWRMLEASRIDGSLPGIHWMSAVMIVFAFLLGKNRSGRGGYRSSKLNPDGGWV
jgi:hypothetical protein